MGTTHNIVLLWLGHYDHNFVLNVGRLNCVWFQWVSRESVNFCRFLGFFNLAGWPVLKIGGRLRFRAEDVPSLTGGFWSVRGIGTATEDTGTFGNIQAMDNVTMDSRLTEVCLGSHITKVRVRGRTLFILNCMLKLFSKVTLTAMSLDWTYSKGCMWVLIILKNQDIALVSCRVFQANLARQGEGR